MPKITFQVEATFDEDTMDIARAWRDENGYEYDTDDELLMDFLCSPEGCQHLESPELIDIEGVNE